WKRRVHQALVIDAGKDEQELERTADELAEKQLLIESKCSGFERSKRCKPNNVMEMEPVACSSRTVQNKDANGKSGAKRRRMEQIQTILDQVDTNVIIEIPETSKDDKSEEIWEGSEVKLRRSEISA
ncbi:unnamed protein product, partial [Allacma fusca]